jgi:hypothetical protein
MDQQMLLLLIDSPQTTTIVLALWSATLLVLSGVNLWNRETKRRLREQVTGLQGSLVEAQTTVSLANQAKELREAEALRLSAERDGFLQRITTLESQTNLEGLRVQVSQHHSEVMETLKRETLAIQLRITETLRENNREILTGFGKHAEKDNEMLQSIAASQASTATALVAINEKLGIKR